MAQIGLGCFLLLVSEGVLLLLFCFLPMCVCLGGGFQAINLMVFIEIVKKNFTTFVCMSCTYMHSGIQKNDYLRNMLLPYLLL